MINLRLTTSYSHQSPKIFSLAEGKEKVAKVIPNAILMSTESEKHFLTSFTSRDKTYLMLFRVWQNALMDTPMNPPELWQWVTKNKTKPKITHLKICSLNHISFVH